MDIKEALTHAEGMTISEASSMTEMALQELAAEVRRLQAELDASKWEHPEYGTSAEHAVVAADTPTSAEG